jgi:drug/metabolite transporter (DMT)-like permease
VSVASKREPYALLAVVSLAAVVVWLVWPEDGDLGLENLKLWTLFVLGSALLLFTPMVRKVFRLDPQRAWQFCAGGASGLAFSWVAFLLPQISTNQAFFGTIAVAAAGLAVATAPGRPETNQPGVGATAVPTPDRAGRTGQADDESE